jgi:hypothetical protein
MGRAGRRWRCGLRRSADSSGLQRSVEAAFAFGAVDGGFVVGVPASELPLACFLGVSALVFAVRASSSARARWARVMLPAASPAGRDVGPVVFGAWLAFRFDHGDLAHVGEVGFGRVAWDFGLGGALVGFAGFGEVGEVVFVGDGPVLVPGGLVGAVGVDPLVVGGGVALVGVGVDVTGG